MRKRLLALLLSSLAFLVTVGSIRAGFDYTDPTTSTVTYDGERIGRVGTFPSGTIAKLMTEFSITEQQAKDKLTAMRKNILAAIDVVAKQDAALAKCLRDALNCERMCLDFVNTDAQASVQPDGSANCRKDPINIGVRKVSMTEVPVYHPDFYATLTNLLHEGLHAKQSYDPGPLDPNTDKAKVQRRKKSSWNEIAAEQLENALINALVPVLTQIEAGGSPQSPAGAAGPIVDAIKMIQDATARMNAAKNLRVAVQRELGGNNHHITCQQAREAAFTAFLASAGTAADKRTMNDAIKRTRWFVLWGQNSSNFGTVRNPLYFGGGPTTPGTLTQTDGETSSTINTGLSSISDIVLLNAGTKAVVAGETGGLGVLVGYEDTDDDGFFESSTATTLVQSPLLEGGMDLLIDRTNPSLSDLLAFPSESNLIYRVTDLDLDGFPEVLNTSPVIAPNPLMEDVVALGSSNDGTVLYGLVSSGIDDAVLEKNDDAVILSDGNTDGFYESVLEWNNFENVVFAPNFVRDPTEGDTFADVYATRFADIEIHLIDENETSLALLGAGNAGIDGDFTILLAQNLVGGDLLQARDVTNGTSSLSNVVVIPALSTIPAGGLGLAMLLLAAGIYFIFRHNYT